MEEEKETIKFANMSYTINNEPGENYGKILMVKKGERINDPNSGYYTLPGGKLEPEEKGGNSLGRLESVIRETLDETSIKITEAELMGIITFNNYERKFPNYKKAPSFNVYIYKTKKYIPSELKGTEEGEPSWQEKSNIKYLPRNPGDDKMYEWIDELERTNKKIFIGVIKHKGEKIDEEGTWVDFV